jgi:hypothetical protein
MTTSARLFATAPAAFMSIASAVSTVQTPALDRVTVPLVVQMNRPFVDVSLRKKDGSIRTARFLVDSGGGSFILTEPLARDVGLTWGKPYREEGTDFAEVTSPVQATLAAFSLTLDPTRVIVQMGGDNILSPAAKAQADGMLPGHVLAQYHVVFDYPGQTFTVARRGALVPKGDALPMPVAKQSGFGRTEVSVDGTAYGMLVDTGASFTMVSEVILKKWGASHPDWRRHQGAFGDAATLGGLTLETMFVPAATWGRVRLDDWGLTSQHEGTFEKYMSAMTRGPIVGSLGGNVLRNFRLEFDYVHEKLYVSR